MDQVYGYTTNPTLILGAGISEYEEFIAQSVATFPDHSLSFEVIADTLPAMKYQAHKIARYGSNVFVKIPAMCTDGTDTSDLVSDLSSDGIHVNVTAIFTAPQVGKFGDAVANKAECYLSIFAGRIADAGFDPVHLIRQARMESAENVSVLWASTREVFNIRHAQDAGADIITVPPHLLTKYRRWGRDLDEYSRQTVKEFRDDAIAAGLSL